MAARAAISIPAWVRDVAKPEGRPRPAGRAVQHYREMQDFQNSKDRPYIHLVDGGVADNLGVRAIHSQPSATAVYARLDLEPVRRALEANAQAMLGGGAERGS